MERTAWAMPQTIVQKFAANEYVANECGDSGTIYKFVCNAPNSNKSALYYYPNFDGQIDGEGHSGNPKVVASRSYKPCYEIHEATDTGNFFDGFIDYNNNKIPDEDEGVIVWAEYMLGEDILQAHATKELDMNTWETLKS